jgi:uncharacterized membrane protein (DUF373 family)
MRLLEGTDTLVYLLVGASFLLAALLSLAFGLYSFGAAIVPLVTSELPMSGNKLLAANALISLVSDLLLTLIILEVMGTVVHYLKTRATSLKPFLFIGIISATRGILAVGARLSITGTQPINQGDFQKSMIELGVNAVVIIALGVTLRLIGHFLEDSTSQAAPEGKGPSAESE